MQRKRIYIIGIIVIIAATILSPISYLAIGKVEKGKVIKLVFSYADLPFFPSAVYPRIEFNYKGKVYTVNGDENQNLVIGDEVKVIFYPWEPEKAKEYNFISLFIDSIIQLPIGLLFWWAFFKSFPKLFLPPESPLSLYNLVYKYRVEQKNKQFAEIPILGRIIIYTLIAMIIALLLNALWTICREIINKTLSYKLGGGIIVIIIILILTIVYKIRKG